MRSRGFTLIELMVVVTISAIMSAALGRLYVEVRVSGARVEAGLELEREASLVTEWLRRDLRGARAIQAAGAGVEIEREGGKIIYRIDERGVLWRNQGEERAIAKRIIAIEPTALERSASIRLQLERPLANLGSARIERRFEVVRFP